MTITYKPEFVTDLYYNNIYNDKKRFINSLHNLYSSFAQSNYYNINKR